MGFGLYFHIPYCQQLCPYCDFAKLKLKEEQDFSRYHSLMLRELEFHAPQFANREITSIAFGGGTPSLYPTELYEDLLGKVKSLGFQVSDTTEIGMEVDPGTIDTDKLRRLQDLGFRRFSVGAQTFSDPHLKSIGRVHRERDILDLVEALKELSLNFSLDILFALPGQTLDELNKDLEKFVQTGAQHLSAYVLDLPKSHRMNEGRPSEDEQVKMFEAVEERLHESGYSRYEISNYSKAGHESHHNLLYWTDQDYLGVGLSSHSYLSSQGDWGVRFWNPRTMRAYERHCQSLDSETKFEETLLGENRLERLSKEESLTDYFHTQLRKVDGLDVDALRQKFGGPFLSVAANPLAALQKSELIEVTPTHIRLSKKGQLFSNLVFQELVF